MKNPNAMLSALAATVLCGSAAQAQLTGTLVVLNKAEASASLLDVATGHEIARLPTGDGPHEAAISPDGRTAVVAKSAISQCENLIVFRNVDQTGLDYLEAIIGRDARAMVPRLGQGEALVFGPAMSCDGIVAVSVEQVEA